MSIVDKFGEKVGEIAENDPVKARKLLLAGYRLQEKRLALFPDRKLYLFDTFHGFDQRDQRYDDDSEIHNLKLDFSDTSVEMVLEKMIWIQNVIIKEGWFPDSAKGVNDEFCCVRLDMDLYQPTKSGLEFFYPRMIHGGYICVHDCRSRNFDGARKAVEEFCKKYSLNYMNMPDDLGTAVIPVG